MATNVYTNVAFNVKLAVRVKFKVIVTVEAKLRRLRQGKVG